MRVERDEMWADGLFMDVYGENAEAAVVLVAGYPDAGFQRRFGQPFKNMSWTEAWAERIAGRGMTAITYTNIEPERDLHRLLDELLYERIALWASSGNAPLALSALPRVAGAALLYPYLTDLDGDTAVADASKNYGFAAPPVELTDKPLFLVRAGHDDMPQLNESFDRFVAAALQRNLPLTVTNHATARHAFDLTDDGEATQGVIRQVLAFLESLS